MSDLTRYDRIRREVLHNSDRIPSLPGVVVEVLRLLDDPNTDIAELENPLQLDPSLVGRMLQAVNSPLYGLGRRVTSIVEAVTILGFRGLRSLVLASSTGEYLSRDYSCYGFDRQGLWRHSISVASGAKQLAQSLGLGKNLSEDVFVAGLLHDIGKMLLGPYLVRECVEVAKCGTSACEVERQVCGTDHQEAGVAIAKKWNMSPVVQNVLENHGGHGASEEFAVELAVVRLADSVAHRHGKCYLKDFEIPSMPQTRDLGLLGMSKNDWQNVQPDMVDSMGEAICSIGSIGS